MENGLDSVCDPTSETVGEVCNSFVFLTLLFYFNLRLVFTNDGVVVGIVDGVVVGIVDGVVRELTTK